MAGEAAPESWYRISYTSSLVSGEYNYTTLPLTLTSNGEGAPGTLAAAASPFNSAPYDEFQAHGFEFGGSSTINVLRLSIVYRKPWPTFNLADTQGVQPVLDQRYTTNVRSVQQSNWRFGIGLELPIDDYSPFAEVVGMWHGVTTELTVDGVHATYRGSVFSYGLRGGFRGRVGPATDLVLSYEHGLTGHTGHSVTLGASFALSSRDMERGYERF